MKTYTVRISEGLHTEFKAFCKDEGLRIEAQAEKAIASALDRMKEERAKRQARIRTANGAKR